MFKSPTPNDQSSTLSHLRNFLQRSAGIWIITWILLIILLIILRPWISPMIPEIPKSSIIVDTNNLQIAETLSSTGKRHEAVKNIPRVLREGLIDLEDRRYYKHFGVDPIWVGRAIWIRVFEGETQWASTLTMGLARQIRGVTKERSYAAKFSEIATALRLELTHSKSEILSLYLERIEFGRLSIGVASAARAYFGIPLWELTIPEQIALLTMIKNPARYDLAREPEAFRERYIRIVWILRDNEIISPSEAEIALADPLKLADTRPELPYIRDMVKSGKYSDASSNTWVKSLTIDSLLTDRVHHIARQVQSDLARKNVGDYGVLVVARDTGEVRVLIGGSAYYADNGQVNSVLAPRQVGSTIKPFTYLLALMDQGRSMSDTITDLPVSYATAEGTSYEPKNYSLKYRGEISLAEALAGSVNIPAVKIASEVWVPRLQNYLGELGITTLTESPDHYGLALTLGVGEMSLWELAQAYTIFADAGQLCPLSLVPALPCADRGTGKAPPEKIAEITETLSNPLYRLHEFSLGSTLDFGDRRIFVKTGTSRNFRDNYTVGITPKYLIGVWTGNKDGSNMQGVSGASGAGEIFAQVVREIDPIGDAFAPAPLRTWNTTKWGKVSTFEITRPLSGTRYKASGSLSIEYWSSLSETTPQYLLEGEILPEKRVNLSGLAIWSHTVTVELLGPRGEKIGEKSSVFEVE